MHARARIGEIRPGVVFVPFHYGYWDAAEVAKPDDHHRAANELTATTWDPVSRQPHYKVAAVRVRKLAGAGGGPEAEATPTSTSKSTSTVGEG